MGRYSLKIFVSQILSREYCLISHSLENRFVIIPIEYLIENLNIIRIQDAFRANALPASNIIFVQTGSRNCNKFIC